MNEQEKNAGSAALVPEQLRAALQLRETLCERLRRLPDSAGGDYETAAAALKAEYAVLPPIPAEYAELLDKKFIEAEQAAQVRLAAIAVEHAQAEKLNADAAKLLKCGEEDLATLKETAVLMAKLQAVPACAAAAAQLKPLLERLQAEEAAAAAAGEQVAAFTAELAALAAGEDFNRLNERKKEIDQAFAALVNIPAEAVKKYHEIHRQVSVKLAQHFETLDLARWESYTLKCDLCAELEKLASTADNELSPVGRRLTEIRAKWKELGSVPKEKEEINQRFLDLTRSLQRRVDEYFSRLRQEQKKSVADKEALCLAVEALKDSTAWKETAEKIRELQAKWKELPSAGRSEHELFHRFHTAAEVFFAAKKADWADREKRFADVEQVKLGLIAEAEAMTDGRNARGLRERFNAAGRAGRREADLLAKFNAAMDKFFADAKTAKEEKVSRGRQLLEQLRGFIAEPAAHLDEVRSLREEFRSPELFKLRAESQKVLREFDQALEAERRRIGQEKRRNLESGADRLSAIYGAWLAGTPAEAPAASDYAENHKLAVQAELLAAAIGGDAKAGEKLKRQAEAGAVERRQILEQLESLCGRRNTGGTALSLAEELKLAMLGNLGKAETVRPVTEPPETLFDRFAAAGIMEPGELAQLQLKLAEVRELLRVKGE